MIIDEILELKKRCNFSDQIGKAFNLTLGEVACISAVAGNRSLTSKDLAAALELSPSRASRIVSRLIESGFIRGEADPLDRRCLTLSLTGLGETCYHEIVREKRLCEERLIAALSETQKNTVREGLEILLQVM